MCAMPHLAARTLRRIVISSALLFSLVVASVLAISGEEKPASEKPQPKKPAVPVFLPGAKVDVELTLALAPGYELGEDPAIVLTFDAKALKKHPFTVSPLEWMFSRKDLGVELTENGERTTKPARLQFTMKKNAAYGDHQIPALLRVYYCSKEEGYCTWTELPVEFRIRVGKDEQALKKGVLKVHMELNEKALTASD